MATSTKPGLPRGLQPPDKKPVRITVPEERKARYGDPFFPKVPFQAIFYIGAIFIVLIFLALASPAPLQDPADPLNHAAIDPRPEWYFMFLFQLLKYFPGNFIIVGTAIIPTVVVILLLLVPFYDRNWARKINRRPVAAASMTLGMLIVMFLTWGGFGFPTPNFNVQSQVVAPEPGVTYSISPAVASIFKAHCGQCHLGQGQGGLNLSTWNGIEAGGTFIPNQPVVIPGDHKNSILWQMVQPNSPWPHGSARMPLGGPYLTSAQITTIASWIDNLGKKTSTGGATTGGTAAVSFKKDIQPLFTAHCAVCHISIQSGGLSLANYASVIKGGNFVPGQQVVVPGNHANSLLWKLTQSSPSLYPAGVPRMPLGGQGGYLTDAQVQSIANWIDQGAKNN